MKKLLLTSFFLIGLISSVIAQHYIPITINETINVGPCEITMSGSATITVYPPAPGDNGLQGECHGQVTLTFGSGCGDFAGLSFNVTFTDKINNNQHTLSGDTQQSESILGSYPDVRTRLRVVIENALSK